jgi:hypothetical protein
VTHTIIYRIVQDGGLSRLKSFGLALLHFSSFQMAFCRRPSLSPERIAVAYHFGDELLHCWG